MRKINFTQQEQKTLIKIITNRKDLMVKENPNWGTAKKVWKEIYYYPLRSSRLKLEDDKNDFTNPEIDIMISCIHDLPELIKTVNGVQIIIHPPPFNSILSKLYGYKN